MRKLNCCTNHPEKETAYSCLKHGIYLCEDCLECRDPEIYCKHRSACAIHFMTKRKGNLDDGDAVKSPDDCDDQTSCNLVRKAQAR